MKIKNISEVKKSLDTSAISFNAGLLVKEMVARGISVSFIGESTVMAASYGKHKELLYDIYSSLLSYPEGWILSDKYYTKQFLRAHNLPVVSGHVFSYTQPDEIMRAAARLKYPAVLKPTVGSHGDHVYVNIEDKDELGDILHTLENAPPGNGYLLIEKFFPANEYRLFIARSGFFAAVQRTPASVIGDGMNTILQLIQRENIRRMNPRENCLCEIALDEITFRYMDKLGITIDDVPKNKERVFLRANSNVSTGGNCEDVTEVVHATVREFAREVLKTLPHAAYVGIDLLCADIRKRLQPGKYQICELNPAPGLSLHMLPELGKSRNVAGELVDLLFPETKNL